MMDRGNFFLATLSLEVISANQEYWFDALGKLTFTRAWIYSLHKERLKLLSTQRAPGDWIWLMEDDLLCFLLLVFCKTTINLLNFCQYSITFLCNTIWQYNKLDWMQLWLLFNACGYFDVDAVVAMNHRQRRLVLEHLLKFYINNWRLILSLCNCQA